MFGKNILTLIVAVVFVATMLPSNSAQAQAVAPHSVTIVVLENYPAFQASSGRAANGSTRELRALVLRRAPWNARESFVILNPAYLSPETLGAALVALRQGQSNLIAVSASRPGRPIPSHTLTALKSKLEELRSRPALYVSKLGTGRTVTIDDVSQYVEPGR